MCLYQIESFLEFLIGLMFISKYTSVVKELSVSWADSKFVTLRVGMPKHLRTGIGGSEKREKERDDGVMEKEG